MSIAMSAAVTGLNNFQQMLNVVSNNISNASTTGYKAQSVNFQELMAQTLTPAAASSATLGGVNAEQIGMGSQIGSISSNMTNGTTSVTGNPTDLALTGNGYFVVQGLPTQPQYTRNGAFQVDSNGHLVNASGDFVQGWQATAAGAVTTTGATTNITIPTGTSMAASPSTKATFTGNLDGSQAIYAAGPPATGGQYSSTATLYDAMGQSYNVTMNYTKSTPPGAAAAAWTYTASLGATTLGTGTIAFNNAGQYDSTDSVIAPINITPTDGAAAVSVTPNFSSLTQLDSSTTGSSVLPSTQDGYPTGSLTNYTINTQGMIVGQYSNGQTQNIAQVAVAQFDNPQGLVAGSGGLLSQSVNSGPVVLGTAGSGALGSITSGALEGSNVNLTTEFTNLITAQQAFNANSKMITTMNTILSDTNNMVQG